MTTSTNTITELLYRHQLNDLYGLLEKELNRSEPINSVLWEIQELNQKVTEFANTYKVPTVGTLKTGYQIGHRPPTNDGYSPTLASNAKHLLEMVNDNCLHADEHTTRMLTTLTTSKISAIPVYRAMPQGQYCLNQGDWVSLSKVYARDHAERYAIDIPIVVAEFFVNTDHLYTSEDSANELGFCSLGVQSAQYFKL